MEIRINSNSVYKILKRINMPNFIEINMLNYNMPPEDSCGVLWLLLENNVDFSINILKTQNRFIYCLIHDNKNDSRLLANFLWISITTYTKEIMK